MRGGRRKRPKKSVLRCSGPRRNNGRHSSPLRSKAKETAESEAVPHRRSRVFGSHFSGNRSSDMGLPCAGEGGPGTAGGGPGGAGGAQGAGRDGQSQRRIAAANNSCGRNAGASSTGRTCRARGGRCQNASREECTA